MIIVTGGAGFIGSNIIKGLNKRGREDILVVDNLSNADKHRNLNCLRFADYIDKKDFLSKLESLGPVDAIFHQGACSSTVESDGIYMMENNYQYSKHLLHFALDRKTPFLYASSASVYGNGDDGFVEQRKAEYPLNVYAFSKTLFDRYVRQISPAPESQVLGLRYFNVYGPQENHKGRMASVAFHLFHQIRENGRMKLFEGSETFRRDFIYVDDVVKVNLHFFERGISGIFNCGTGNAQSFAEIATSLRELAGSGEVETIPFPEELKGKYQTFTEASLEALRSTGYKEDFDDLQQGITKYHKCLEETGGYIRD